MYLVFLSFGYLFKISMPASMHSTDLLILHKLPTPMHRGREFISGLYKKNFFFVRKSLNLKPSLIEGSNHSVYCRQLLALLFRSNVRKERQITWLKLIAVFFRQSRRFTGFSSTGSELLPSSCIKFVIQLAINVDLTGRQN
jgi:hypothetical protein